MKTGRVWPFRRVPCCRWAGIPQPRVFEFLFDAVVVVALRLAVLALGAYTALKFMGMFA